MPLRPVPHVAFVKCLTLPLCRPQEYYIEERETRYIGDGWYRSTYDLYRRCGMQVKVRVDGRHYRLYKCARPGSPRFPEMCFGVEDHHAIFCGTWEVAKPPPNWSASRRRGEPMQREIVRVD